MHAQETTLLHNLRKNSMLNMEELRCGMKGTIRTIKFEDVLNF